MTSEPITRSTVQSSFLHRSKAERWVESMVALGWSRVGIFVDGGFFRAVVEMRVASEGTNPVTTAKEDECQ